MRFKAFLLLLPLALVALPTPAQETPAAMVAAYSSLADTILDLRQAEADFVRALLDGHRHAAKVLMKNEKWQQSAAQMALFANEGDNAVGGVRKRLIEGGHHHNAAGEAQGIYEPGFVIVTREAKQKILAASTALRQAADQAARDQAWKDFASVAKSLLEE